MSTPSLNNKPAPDENADSGLVNFWKQIRHDRWRLCVAFVLAFFTWWALKDIVSDKHWITVSDLTPHLQASPTGQDLYINGTKLSHTKVAVDLTTSFWKQNTEYSQHQFLLNLNADRLTVGKDRSREANDHTRTEPLRTIYELKPEDITEMPKEVSLRRFTPASFPIEWDYRVTREVPISTREQNFLPPNFEIRVEIASGPNVRLNGPIHLLNQYPSVALKDAITIPYGAESFTKIMPLRLDELNQRGIRCDREEVTVKVTITDSSERISRNITGVRLKVLNRPDNPFVLSPDCPIAPEVSVFVSGPRREVEALKAEKIIACCDASSFSTGSYQAEVQILNLPSTISLVSRQPEKQLLQMIPRPAPAKAPASKP